MNSEAFSEMAQDAVVLLVKVAVYLGLDVTESLEIVAERVEYVRQTWEDDKAS